MKVEGTDSERSGGFCRFKKARSSATGACACQRRGDEPTVGVTQRDLTQAAKTPLPQPSTRVQAPPARIDLAARAERRATLSMMAVMSMVAVMVAVFGVGFYLLTGDTSKAEASSSDTTTSRSGGLAAMPAADTDDPGTAL